MKLFLLLMLLIIGDEAISQNCTEANSIAGVTKRKTGRTEYVIFNIINPATTTPEVTTQQPPFIADGSGNTINVKGCRYKRVRFSNAVWTCNIPVTSANTTYLIQQLKKTSQFEGIIDFVIGYRCNTKSVVSYSYTSGNFTKFVVRLKY